jgi:two-component system, cell cycle sensor histidine kinase and response regulator CckA
VKLEVSDEGCGMTSEVRDRIFDPFFTTKSKGRGLGLAAVVGIIRGHKGLLHLESQVGQGSTFTMYLPAMSGT